MRTKWNRERESPARTANMAATFDTRRWTIAPDKTVRLLMLLAICFLTFASRGQIRMITGKVIDEIDLTPIPGVKIQSRDTALLGTTDLDGNFEIKLLSGTEELLLSFIGMEWTAIKVPIRCNVVDVIMMHDGTYDYKSNKKVDRMRKQRFDNLQELYSQAVKKGVFNNTSPCYSREFIPYKPRLDGIGKELEIKRKQIKESFKKLEIGDTLSIPFSAEYRHDGTDRTTLFNWSYVTDKKDFDCIIKGVILAKDNLKGGYNLLFNAINCDLCKHGSIIYENKDMVVGRQIRYNMKYFKVLTK